MLPIFLKNSAVVLFDFFMQIWGKWLKINGTIFLGEGGEGSTFTKEILNEKLHFLCFARYFNLRYLRMKYLGYFIEIYIKEKKQNFLRRCGQACLDMIKFALYPLKMSRAFSLLQEMKNCNILI